MLTDPSDWVPNIPVAYWSFRLMMGLGFLAMGIAAFVLWTIRKGALPKPGTLWTCLLYTSRRGGGRTAGPAPPSAFLSAADASATGIRLEAIGQGERFRLERERTVDVAGRAVVRGALQPLGHLLARQRQRGAEDVTCLLYTSRCV